MRSVTITLDEKRLCVLVSALGYFGGQMEAKNEESVRELMQKVGLQSSFENKNELLAEVRSLLKSCIAQTKAQT